MRMRWVVEDYEALARLIDGANRFGRDETALAPGRLIRLLRRGLQVSQLQLAKRAGVPRSLVERVESGGDVQIGSLRRLLGALGCGLVILPASDGLLARFKAKAKEKRRSDRQWEQVCRRLEKRPAPAKPQEVLPGNSRPPEGPVAFSPSCANVMIRSPVLRVARQYPRRKF